MFYVFAEQNRAISIVVVRRIRIAKTGVRFPYGPHFR